MHGFNREMVITPLHSVSRKQSHENHDLKSLLFLCSSIGITKNNKILSKRLAEGWECALDEATKCESNIRWKDLGHELVNVPEFSIIDNRYKWMLCINVSRTFDQDLDRVKQDACDLTIVKRMEDDTWVRYRTQNM